MPGTEEFEVGGGSVVKDAQKEVMAGEASICCRQLSGVHVVGRCEMVLFG